MVRVSFAGFGQIINGEEAETYAYRCEGNGIDSYMRARRVVGRGSG